MPMQPRPMAETVGPLVPSLRVCIVISAFPTQWPSWPGLSRPPRDTGVPRVRGGAAARALPRPAFLGGRDKPGHDGWKVETLRLRGLHRLQLAPDGHARNAQAPRDLHRADAGLLQGED